MNYKMPRFPSIKWKQFILITAILLISFTLVKIIPNFFSGGDQEVSFVVLDNNEIPERVMQIFPRYKMLERALATEIEEEIYVIVTRGEKSTGGYTVSIESIYLVEENEVRKLIVNATFKEPDDDELVAQVITHPFVVVKTNLRELPDVIDLQIADQD
ncbi:MAG: protease complex subunit PrcB family protein [Alkaliphilus sp.]